MEEQSYAVVFQGELVAGVEPAGAKARLAELFNLTEEVVERLFSSGRATLKKGLDRETAERLQQLLRGIGLVTAVTAAAGEGAPPAAVAAAAPPAAAAAERFRAEFTGAGGEFFKIWIVNVLLSLVTLGVYSAWAKVRTHRYFYGNTLLAGSSFEYLADPIAILKGRAIVVTLFVGASLIGALSPIAGALLNLAFIPLVPWLICRGLAFRNRNTAWRNVRFGFDGGLGEATKAFILWPILAPLTLGLLFPYALKRQHQFVLAHSRFGTRPFGFEPPLKQYFKILGVTSLIAIGCYFAAGVPLGILFALNPDSGQLLMSLVPVIGLLLMVLAGGAAYAYYSARISNLKLNHLTLGAIRFESRLSARRLFALYAGNSLLLLLTLGLALPWAKVRLARYRASCLTLVAEEGLDGFVAAREQEVGALGDEMGEAFDLDFGL